MKTNKWKLALLAWLAMFPFCTTLSYGLTWLPFTAQWPLILRTFCLTGMLVPFMVFGALPFLNRRFQRWLQTPVSESGVASTPRAETTTARLAESPVEKSRVEVYNTFPRLAQNGVEA